jgi:glutamate formiminotransferase/formiminotetrahydrofolate cyclodeaminase
MVKKGNQNSLSDAGVAGLTASAAAEGALYNVLINLQGIQDEKFKSKVREQALKLNDEVQKVVKKIKKQMRIGLNIDAP